MVKVEGLLNNGFSQIRVPHGLDIIVRKDVKSGSWKQGRYHCKDKKKTSKLLKYELKP